MEPDTFSSKLALTLKVLMLSRTGLAAALNVDKSLVGRWVAGTVKPSEYNLANLTRFVAEHIPGFTVLDWERHHDAFKTVLGVETDPAPTTADLWVPSSFLEEVRSNTSARGPNYCGLWRCTRPSIDMPGQFIHDISMVYERNDGTLGFKSGVEGVRYQGWALLMQHQLFCCAFDETTGAVLFSILNGVSRQKPQVVDGLNLATLRDAGGSPAASACILERVADSSGDRRQDDALFEKTVAELNPLAPPGSVPEAVAKHLTEGVTAEAEGFLRLLYSQSLARGQTLAELAGVNAAG